FQSDYFLTALLQYVVKPVHYHLRYAPVEFYPRNCGNVILNGCFGKFRSLIQKTLPASVVVQRSRSPYHKLKLIQNPYHPHISAIHGKASPVFAEDLVHAHSFFPVYRMIHQDGLWLRSPPYQTDASGSIRVHALHKNPPHDGSKVYVRNSSSADHFLSI